MTIDWDAAGREAASMLQGLLRFDTTNPPGDEAAIVEHLAGLARREGLEVQVLRSSETRANLAVRLRGDATQRPVLLLSHLDVVPAEPAQWSHPPFAGEVADGFIFGRGAIDSKLTTAVQLQALLMCKRLGLPLKRDLVLVAAADEEMGGVFGMQWLMAEHPELFDAEYGINEAGGFAVMIDGTPIYTCQVGEKGGANVDLVVHGRPGHSSVPHSDNPIVHMGAVLDRLGGKLPHRLTPSVRAFFEGAAKHRPDLAEDLLGLLAAQTHEAALARLPLEEPVRLMFDAMLRNTCAPTILEAGTKRNVIPSEAVVQLSGRPLPGVDEAEFLQEVQALVGDAAQCRSGIFRAGVEFDHRTPLFGAMERALQRHEPGAALVPYMQTGGTDGRFLVDRDISIYGFIPMRYEPGMDFFELCHGHDERVSLDNVRFAVQVIFDVIRDLNLLEEGEN